MTAILIIDCSLHTSSVPATYIAPGALQLLGVAATQGSTTGTIPTNAALAFSADTYTITPGNIIMGNDSDVIAGSFTGTGAAVVIPVGFYPSHIQVVNWTGVIKWEWMAGAPATDTMKTVTAGTETSDTTSAITVTSDGAGGNGNVCYVTLSAALAVNAQVISFRIEA